VTETFANILNGYIELFSQPDTGRGCLVVLGAINCRHEHQDVVDKLKVLRLDTHRRVTLFLQEAAARGELKAEACPEALAEFFMAIFNGLSVQAWDGSSPAKMRHIVEQAVRLFATWTDKTASVYND